jgi:hypothetical protein
LGIYCSTFDQNNVMTDRSPIQKAVILVAENGKDGKLKLLAKYGQNKFFDENFVEFNLNLDFICPTAFL